MESGLLVSILFMTLFPALATAGIAALLFVWMPKTTRAVRVALASVLAPLVLFVPILAAAGVDIGWSGMDTILVSLGMIGVPAVVIGWPVAFFLTRALDRQRTVIDNSVFE